MACLHMCTSTCKAPPGNPDYLQGSTSTVPSRRSSICLHNRHRTTVRTFALFDLSSRLHKTMALIFTTKMSTVKVSYNVRQPIDPSSSLRGGKAPNMTSKRHDYTTSPFDAFDRDWLCELKRILHHPTSTLLEYQSHDTFDC